MPDLSYAEMMSAMHKQRGQDFFYRATMTFARSVLLVLIGAIISLVIGAWPAFRLHRLAPGQRVFRSGIVPRKP